jgi:hypothetical protein
MAHLSLPLESGQEKPASAVHTAQGMQRRAPLQHRLSCQTEPAPVAAAAALLPPAAAAAVTARGGGAATHTLRQSLRQSLGTAATAVPAAAAAAAAVVRRSEGCTAKLWAEVTLEVTRPVVTRQTAAAAVAAVAAAAAAVALKRSL